MLGVSICLFVFFFELDKSSLNVKWFTLNAVCLPTTCLLACKPGTSVCESSCAHNFATVLSKITPKFDRTNPQVWFRPKKKKKKKIEAVYNCINFVPLYVFFLFSIFATVFGGPCWMKNRMQALFAATLVSFFDTRSFAHLFTQSNVQTWMKESKSQSITIAP